jgi:hypothetical protein
MSNIINDVLKMFGGVSYDEINKHCITGFINTDYEKIPVHIEKKDIERKDVINMIKYCKLNKFTTIVFVVNKNYSWIDDLLKYNNIDCKQILK